MTLYATLFVIFAGFAFTTTGAHPFPVKSVTPILMAVLDIVTNSNVDYTSVKEPNSNDRRWISAGGFCFISQGMASSHLFGTANNPR